MALAVTLMTVRPGGTQTSPVEALLHQYLRRCGPFFAADAKTFRTAPALLAAAAERQKREAAVLWLADRDGANLTSEAFADLIRRTRDGGKRHILLAVGPADGWTADARAKADLRISLGPMTLPHELAALVLAEQTYRASAILQGHPYHSGH